MDALDVRILRAMRVGWWYLPSQEPDAFKPGVIAKAVGSTPETVKERVKRLEDAGIVAGYRLVPWIGYLGLDGAAYAFQVGDEDLKVRAMEQAPLVDGVTVVFDYVAPTLSVLLAYGSAGELTRRLALLSQQTGDPEPVLTWQATRRDPTMEVTALDWRLIQALRQDAVRPLEDIAEEVGVTYRTVKRRLDPLFRAGVIERSVLLDPGRVPGLLPVELDLRLRDEAPGTVRAVLRAFDDRAVQSFPRAGRRGQHLNLWLFASTLAEAEQLRRSAAALPGVKRAHALLRRGVVYCDAWLDDLIAARAKGG